MSVFVDRFPLLLDLLPPERVASKIVKAMRRNYKELSLPTPMLTLDRISRYGTNTDHMQILGHEDHVKAIYTL